MTSFTRIPTGDVVGVQAGVYIISSLDASARDPLENYGFIVRYRAKDATERVRTYSLRTSSPRKSPAKGTSSSASSRPLTPLKLPFPIGKTASPAPLPPADVPKGETHFIAFKALRRDAVKVAREDGSSEIIDRRAGDDIEGKTAKDVVWSIVNRLKEECEKVGAVGDGDDDWLVEKDIIRRVLSLPHYLLRAADNPLLLQSRREQGADIDRRQALSLAVQSYLGVETVPGPPKDTVVFVATRARESYVESTANGSKPS